MYCILGCLEPLTVVQDTGRMSSKRGMRLAHAGVLAEGVLREYDTPGMVCVCVDVYGVYTVCWVCWVGYMCVCMSVDMFCCVNMCICGYIMCVQGTKHLL